MSLSDSTTRSLQIVTGSSTCVFTYPNRLAYQLPTSGYRSGRDEIALKSLSLYYSWPNISSANRNNTFSYIWPGDNVTYSVVYPDGIFQFADLIAYFESVMFSRGHYLLDNSGNTKFYIRLVLNAALYCLSLVMTPLPTTLPVGWQNPRSVNLTTAAGHTPQLIIPTAEVASLTGFAVGTYPSSVQTMPYNINSGIPQISQITSLNLVSNLVDNSGFSLTPSILASFNIPNGQSSGSLVVVQPNNLDWVPVQQQQTFQYITVELVDQLMRPVPIRDPTGLVLILNLRKRI